MTVNWYVVANRVLARFFRDVGNGDMELVANLENPRGALKNSEIVSDRMGRARYSKGALVPGVTPKRYEMLAFAKKITTFLDEHRRKGEFDRIALVADPQLLGALRDSSSAKLSQCIGATLEKNLSHVDERDIANVLTPVRMSTL